MQLIAQNLHVRVAFCVYASRLAVPLNRILYGTKVQILIFNREKFLCVYIHDL